MKIEQRDLVEFHVVTLTSAPGPHPCVVISNQETFLEEGYFYAVMISSKSYGEDFEYEITPEMVTKQLTKTSYAKTQIIVQLTPDMITRRQGKLKVIYFEEMLTQLNREVFSFEM